MRNTSQREVIRVFGYMVVRAIVGAKPLERVDELTMGKGGGSPKGQGEREYHPISCIEDIKEQEIEKNCGQSNQLDLGMLCHVTLVAFLSVV